MFHGLITFLQSLQTRRGEQGQGMVEYALILALVSITAIIVLVLFGPVLQEILSTVLSALET